MKACVLDWMKSQMPDSGEEIFEQIYSEYKTTATTLLQKWKDALASNADEKTVDAIAHTLKGNAAMVGDQEISQLAQSWREAVKIKDLQRSDEILRKLEELVGLL